MGGKVHIKSHLVSLNPDEFPMSAVNRGCGFRELDIPWATEVMWAKST